MRFLLLLGLIDFSFCGVLDDYNIIEGDILERKNAPGASESALASSNSRWPNAIVPYRIDNVFSNSEKQKIHEAMEEIHQKTCVRFREARESASDQIRIVKEGTCASFVGRQGNVQHLSLDRADRDEHIDIVWEHIKEGQKHNFQKRKLHDLTLMDTPYSYNSIMHYRSDVFAKYKGYKTIVPKKKGYDMGEEEELSDIDVKRIQKLYCPDKPAPPPPTTIEGFNFQRGGGGIMWSNGCDFYGNNIDQKQMEGKDCGDHCARNPKCSHFTWNQHNGGTCYLKAGIAPDARPQTADWSFVCGYRGLPISEGSWKQGEQGVWWSNGCDFPGTDITTVKIKPELCSDECMKRRDCTHFTWNAVNGGTCFLKKDYEGKPKCASYFYVCGYIGSVGNGGSMLCN